MNREILKKTSRDTGYDQDTIDHVNRYLWKYLRDLMGKGDFEGLMLKKFGTFGVSDFSKRRTLIMANNDWRPAEYAKEKRERRAERLAIWLGQQSVDTTSVEGEIKSM